MTMKITTDVFESSLHCKYKAFLKLTGHRGVKSDYESLLAATREQVRLVMIDKMVAAHADDEVDRNVPLNRPHTKVAYDLRITATGIRRRVIECGALTHRCSQCGKCFLPPEYKKRDKHCHALKSWAMYHHVVHRISFEQLERMIEESFNLRVGSAEFHMMPL